MEDPLDLDDQLLFWERELEEDAARLDVMPPALPDAAENRRIIEVSFRAMLTEIARKLPALDPLFDTWFRYGGFFSHVRVYVLDLAVPVKLHEEFCSSGEECVDLEGAEEKAAERMIRILEKKYGFETKDLNWSDKRRFHIDSYNCCDGWRRAREENRVLKMKVESLAKGWHRTLNGLDRACDLVPSHGYASPEDTLPVVLYEGIAEFEEVGERYHAAG